MASERPKIFPCVGGVIWAATKGATSPAPAGPNANTATEAPSRKQQIAAVSRAAAGLKFTLHHLHNQSFGESHDDMYTSVVTPGVCSQSMQTIGRYVAHTIHYQPAGAIYRLRGCISAYPSVQVLTIIDKAGRHFARLSSDAIINAIGAKATDMPNSDMPTSGAKASDMPHSMLLVFQPMKRLASAENLHLDADPESGQQGIPVYDLDVFKVPAALLVPEYCISLKNRLATAETVEEAHPSLVAHLEACIDSATQLEGALSILKRVYDRHDGHGDRATATVLLIPEDSLWMPRSQDSFGDVLAAITAARAAMWASNSSSSGTSNINGGNNVVASTPKWDLLCRVAATACRLPPHGKHKATMFCFSHHVCRKWPVSPYQERIAAVAAEIAATADHVFDYNFSYLDK